MDSSQNLKQRTAAETSSADADVDAAGKGEVSDVDMKKAPRRGRRITKRGLSSLAVSVALPVSLTLLAMYLGSANTYEKTTSSKPPFWFPPLWALHFTSVASAFLMGLSAWLVWAEGGFHASPLALYLYLSQLGLSLAWDPLVFGAGSNRVGLALCMGMFGSLVGCYQSFKEISPLAADIIKPCLAWTAFLALVNLTLLYI